MKRAIIVALLATIAVAQAPTRAWLYLWLPDEQHPAYAYLGDGIEYDQASNTVRVTTPAIPEPPSGSLLIYDNGWQPLALDAHNLSLSKIDNVWTLRTVLIPTRVMRQAHQPNEDRTDFPVGDLRWPETLKVWRNGLHLTERLDWELSNGILRLLRPARAGDVVVIEWQTGL